MPQTIKPMAPATIRRLMASAEAPAALRWQRLQEAEAMGRLAGLLLIRRIAR